VSELIPHLTFAFWIGALSLISVCVGLGLTYAAFFSDRGFRFGLKAIVAIVSCVCVLSTVARYVDEANLWLAALFLAITVPIANFLAVIALLGVIWFRKKTGRLWGKQKIEPYVGPVRQRPVDVVREPKRLEHRH